MSRCSSENPRAVPSFVRSDALRSAERLSFLIRYRSSSRCSPGTSDGIRPAAAVSSVRVSSSPSGTGEGGGGGCVYATRSFDSLMPSLPLAKSSAKSVTPPDATLCTRNLSLHPATSAGHSRCACMMTCTICVAPGATKPVLGFTQYFFGAVVFTLNASSAVVALYRRIVVGICFFSSTVSR